MDDDYDLVEELDNIINAYKWRIKVGMWIGFGLGFIAGLSVLLVIH